MSVRERCRRNVTKIVVLTLDCRTNLRDSLQRRRRPIRRTRPTARTATCACVRAAYHTRDRQRPDAATTTPFGNSLVVCGDGSRRGRPLKNGPAIRRTDESRVELEPCFRPKLHASKILHLKKFPNSWGQADGRRTIAARSHQTIARSTKTEHVADIALPAAAKTHPSLTPSRALTCLAPRCVNPQKSRPRPNTPRRRPRPNPRLSFPSHEFVANEVIGTRTRPPKEDRGGDNFIADGGSDGEEMERKPPADTLISM